MDVRWWWRYTSVLCLSVCLCVFWLVRWRSGRLGQKSFYFRERYYSWVLGRGRLRVEVDLVLVSHLASGEVYTIVLRVAHCVLHAPVTRD